MHLASLAGVHPRLYPFVQSGPACSCTHARVTHVGTNVYGIAQPDLGCTVCELCEGYTPLEAIDDEAENREYAELTAAQARRRELHRRVMMVLFLVALVTVPILAVFASGLALPWLFILVGTNLLNMGASSWHDWRVGDLETVDLVVQCGFTVSAFLFGATALAHLTVSWPLLIVMLGFTAAFMVLNHRRVRESTRSLERFIADMEDDQP